MNDIECAWFTFEVYFHVSFWPIAIACLLLAVLDYFSAFSKSSLSIPDTPLMRFLSYTPSSDWQRFVNWIAALVYAVEIGFSCYFVYYQHWYSVCSVLFGILLSNIVMEFLLDYTSERIVYLISRKSFIEKLSEGNLNEQHFEKVGSKLAINVAFLRFFKYTFVSHRWEQSLEGLPDSTDGRQTKLITSTLEESWDEIIISVLHNFSDQTRGLFPASLLLFCDYVWIDYMCVPQGQEAQAKQQRMEQICLFRAIAENSTRSLIVPQSGTTSDGDIKEYLCRGWCLLEYTCLSRRKIVGLNDSSDVKNLHRNIYTKVKGLLGSESFDPSMSEDLWTNCLTIGSDSDRSVIEFNLRDKITFKTQLQTWANVILRKVFDPFRGLVSFISVSFSAITVLCFYLLATIFAILCCPCVICVGGAKLAALCFRFSSFLVSPLIWVASEVGMVSKIVEVFLQELVLRILTAVSSVILFLNNSSNVFRSSYSSSIDQRGRYSFLKAGNDRYSNFELP
mmetsp:Transcript_1960/g.2534  ORF Transcript_1960/g.2534 Transcript_1960/m.2534 type:complete len:508 (+) Transcript_1960:47-1570(+)